MTVMDTFKMAFQIVVVVLKFTAVIDAINAAIRVVGWSL
jgi:hypothetical protein